MDLKFAVRKKQISRDIKTYHALQSPINDAILMDFFPQILNIVRWRRQGAEPPFCLLCSLSTPQL